MLGITRTLVFGFFLYAFFVGSIFIEQNVLNPNTGKLYTIQEIVSVGQAILMAMIQLTNIVPNLRQTVKALVVGRKVFDILERKPLVADSENAVEQNIEVKDGITFDKVKFRYPTAYVQQPDTF